MNRTSYAAVKALLEADPPGAEQWAALAAAFPTAAGERRERLVTKREAATRLAVSERQLERWAAEGKLRACRFGRRLVRFQEAEILRLMAAGGEA